VADPPTFTSDNDVKFEHWKDLLASKLLYNADHFVPPNGDVETQEDNRTHYAKSKVGGTALGYLLPHIKAMEARDEIVTVANVVDFLEGIFVNPHQQSKARSKLRTYKIKPS
jgi:hypothetical protein